MRYRPGPTIRQLYFADKATLSTTEQEELERFFFSRLRLSNGVFKTTDYRRLDDVNQVIAKWLPRDRTLALMDVAVSSGVSTLEWMQSLEDADIAFQMTGGDMTMHADLYTIGTMLTALVEKSGYPLQFDWCGMSFPNASGSRFRNASFRLTRCLFPLLRRLSRKQPFTLVSPEVLEHSETLTLVEDDIATNRDTGLARQFDVVRAANILQPSYFDEQTIVGMLKNLAARIIVGGHLVVCRTDEEGRNQGTVFRLTGDEEFEAVDRVGAGSEIEDLVLAMRC